MFLLFMHELVLIFAFIEMFPCKCLFQHVGNLVNFIFSCQKDQNVSGWQLSMNAQTLFNCSFLVVVGSVLLEIGGYWKHPGFYVDDRNSVVEKLFVLKILHSHCGAHNYQSERMRFPLLREFKSNQD